MKLNFTEVINMFEEKINGECPVETTIKLLGGKYKSTILWALRDGTLRYGELQECVSQASPKMLAEQLNEMIEDKLIRKTVYPVVPPKTEYSLTAFGKAAIPLLQMITDYGRRYLEADASEG